jgi:hypothetical protein
MKGAMTQPMRARLLVLALLASLGCGGGSAGNNGGSSGSGGGSGGAGGGAGSGGMSGGQTANGQACQLLKAGPFTPVTGKVMYTFTDQPPPVLNDRKAYRITLPAPSRVGHVSFKVPAPGEYVVFTSRALPVSVYTWDGVIINSKTVAGSVSECGEVKGRESFDLLVDTKSHILRFGPGSDGTVDLVLTTATP